jgi:alcohol oxidase
VYSKVYHSFTILNSILNPLGPIRQIHARQLVVLSAGALGTPMILERSGVGNGSHLTSMGVRTISDIPGVGANFKDHYICVGPIARVRACEDETMDRIQRMDPATIARLSKDFEKGQGGLTSNFIDVGFKWRPSEYEIEQMGSHFRSVWESKFANKPDRAVLNMALFSWYASLIERLSKQVCRRF